MKKNSNKSKTSSSSSSSSSKSAKSTETKTTTSQSSKEEFSSDKNQKAATAKQSFPPIPSQVQDHLRKFHYQVVKYLCGGSTSFVYQIRDTRSGEFAAAKVMDISRLPSLVRTQLLPNELRIVRRVRHPNIVRTDHVFSLPGFACIVAEFAPDGDIITYIERQNGEPPNLTLAKRWFTQITRAIKYLHAGGVAHRDIKADNVLLFGDTAKLTDFGYACVCIDEQGETVPCTSCCGTLEYKAPEILLFTAPYNGLISDCFSLGVLLFVLVTHRFPFGAGEEIRTTNGLANLHHDIAAKKWPKLGEIKRQYKLQSLLYQLLNPDIRERITASQALEHPWLEMPNDRPVPIVASGVIFQSKDKSDCSLR